DLLILEEQEGSVNFKFGVLYMKSGQRKDEEMYNNETSSPQFEKFLSILGDKIRLKGWDKYRGGLDVRSDMTGRHSYHTVYEGHEIMFHVSTLLPFTQDQRQQVRSAINRRPATGRVQGVYALTQCQWGHHSAGLGKNATVNGAAP
ncbi:unnamed protein product, partial [Cyprideis torosa]